MKKVWVGFIVALLAVAMAQGQTTGSDTKIKAVFHTPAGTAAYPYVLCSSGVTTSCLQGYTETLTPPVTGATQATVTSACTGTATLNCFTGPDANGNITGVWSPGGNLFTGTWTVSVVANWLDNTGKAVASAPLTTTVVEAVPFVPSPVTGLSASPQP